MHGCLISYLIGFGLSKLVIGAPRLFIKSLKGRVAIPAIGASMNLFSSFMFSVSGMGAY